MEWHSLRANVYETQANIFFHTNDLSKKRKRKKMLGSVTNTYYSTACPSTHEIIHLLLKVAIKRKPLHSEFNQLLFRGVSGPELSVVLVKLA